MTEEAATRPLSTPAPIGFVVKEWRSFRGMTGTELAEKAELDKSYIWQLEKDKIKQPKGAILERIAKALRIPTETLTLRKMPPTDTQPFAVDRTSATQALTRSTLFAGRRPESLEHDTSPMEIEDRVGARLTLVRATGDKRKRADYDIRARFTSIGRDDTRVDILLDDPCVSRVHARLIEDPPGQFWLHDGDEDRPSKNGTFVNDARIPAGVPYEMRDGDVIQIADFLLFFEPLRARDRSAVDGA